MQTSENIVTKDIWSLLEEVYDPEVPVLSVVDLGIIRDVKINKAGNEDEIEVVITPTYSGCPAMDVIRMNIRMVLLEHGYKNVQITTILSPAWTTDWMTSAGKEKLKAFGIAPPNPKQQVCNTQLFAEDEAVQCIVIHTIPAALVSLDQPPANRCFSVTTATNHSIILSAIKKLHAYVIYSFYD
jgi:ring-1,2-phenylacetyl-CoA epoxidase subunit PaaD